MPYQVPSVKPVLEVRERLERRVERDFDSNAKDDRVDLLSRYRLGVKFPIGKAWQGEFRWQYAHTMSWTPQQNSSLWNSDADLAYMQTDLQGTTVTIGRQKLALGSQALIGSLEWANAGRSFDGIRLKRGPWDLWAAKISVGNPKPRDARLAGLGNRNRLGLTSLIHKTDKTAGGKVANTTLNHSHSKTYGGIGLDLEGALQQGRVGGVDQEAWALHLQATRVVDPRTTVFVTGNAASGGQSGGQVSTFDQLYGSNHARYGLMDMQGWRNMRELAIGFDHKSGSGIRFRVSWHRFMLEDAKDAWYGAGGVPNRHATGVFRDPTGSSGSDVGSELDFEAHWNPKENLSASAGIASFQPGRFVRKVGGSADTQTWGYVQVQVRF